MGARQQDSGDRDKSCVNLARLSHDLRTPMNSITGFTKIALEHLDDPVKVQECLQRILDSGQHMTALINDILDQGRLESGKVSVAHQPFCLADVTAWVAAVVQVQISEKALQFSVNLDEVSHNCVMGDEVRLKQVLLNLVSNAVKFTPAQGTVALVVREQPATYDEAWFEFEVLDTGCGMSAEFMEVLFEPFSREALPAVHLEEGTGLGMVIAKGLVELMGGTIAVKSQVGEGTSVVVRLPLRPNDVEGSPLVLSVDQGLASAPLAGRHVLVADDDSLSRELMRELLGQHGIAITEAADGREALEKVVSAPHGFDAVLVDMHMPQMDGIAVTRAIRSLEREDLATVPVIAVSADCFQEDCARALEQGVDDYITKPLDGRQLLGTLARYVAH